MLDFSWSEFLVVIIVAVIAVGPKQLPEVLYGLGKIVRRLQYMRYALTRQFDDFMEQAELKDVQKDIHQATRIVPANLFDTEEAEADEAVAALLDKPKSETVKEKPDDPAV